MASLRKENDRGRVGWRLRFYIDKSRKSLWLGAMSKRAADTVARHVEELARAKMANTTPDADTAKWSMDLDGRIRETLCNWGLIDPSQTRNEDADRLLGTFCTKYITGRSDVSERTRGKYQQTRRLLVGMFGADCLLKSITKADAKRWQRWLTQQVVRRDDTGKPLRTMAAATASKHVKRAKTMFREAVDARLIAESPMDAIRGGEEVNRDRDFFIDRMTAAAVLEACPDHDWRLIFALARYGGFRVCELLNLTWSDILWDQNRIRNDSPKTGLRFVPLFPELAPILEAAFDAAQPGQVRCLERFSKNANLGTHMIRIIERAGLESWPKTFQNLRATRRTELDDRYPGHVADAWMGHDSATAKKHYSQVTPEHWALGATLQTSSEANPIGGPTGGPIPAAPNASQADNDHEKTRKTQGNAGSRFVEKTEKVPPQGLEPWTQGLRVPCSTN